MVAKWLPNLELVDRHYGVSRYQSAEWTRDRACSTRSLKVGKNSQRRSADTDGNSFE